MVAARRSSIRWHPASVKRRPATDCTRCRMMAVVDAAACAGLPDWPRKRVVGDAESTVAGRFAYLYAILRRNSHAEYFESGTDGCTAPVATGRDRLGRRRRFDLC